MKSKILMKISTVAMLFLVGVGFIGNTASLSASSLQVVSPQVEFTVSNISNQEMERGVLGTGKAVAKILRKVINVLPSWAARPFNKFLGPILNAVEKLESVTKAALKNILKSFGLNNAVVDIILDVIMWFI